MDRDIFVELTLARFRGTMAAAMLACGRTPTDDQMRVFRNDDPTARDMAMLFSEAGARVDFYVTPMRTDADAT